MTDEVPPALRTRVFGAALPRAFDNLRDDPHLRNRLGNIGHVMSGNFVGSGIALLAVAVTARALGPHVYGNLVLTIVFARLIERLVSFQSWQPMIRYGAGLDTRRDAEALKSLFKFGLLLDIAAGMVAWLVALLAAFIAYRFFGWSAQALQLTAVYCTVLLFNLGGMPTAVLRLAGRFRAASYGQVASSIVRLALCLVAIQLGAGLWGFALIWMGTQILGSLLFLGVGIAELRRQGITGLFGASTRGVSQRFPGLWRFTWSANLSLTLRSSASQFDTLLVGLLADPTSAGLYHIAKQLGKMAQQVATQVQSVLYPDVARLWAAGAIAEFRRAVVQAEVMLALAGVAGFVVALVAARPLLALVAGPEFAAAAPLLIVQMIAVTLMMSGSVTQAALMAMGRARETLNVVIVGTIAFHALAFLLIPGMGAMGVNVAHIVLGLITVTGLAITLRKGIAEARARPTPAPAAQPLAAEELQPWP
ncbi:lipopolysaccharide biosynthesis protein [Sandarakinorhabdus sp. DWP1-3-1]|uniref:lipopolysaccharide biosynthesis protein n=1 Tax=Sandarakinorhabdus sp. DWP1-3-1 TaxID=2804627 RepID=UPI003CEC4149